MAPPSENTANVIYSHCTDRSEHHTVAVLSLGGATEYLQQNICNEIGWPRFFAPPCRVVEHREEGCELVANENLH